MSEYLISIIMPTFNSEKTLEMSLKSIKGQQNINQNQIEILVIDGGSTDATLEIARRYKATILKNEQRLPEFAKQIGLIEAKGKYGIFIDSDEAFTNVLSLSNRVRCLEEWSQVKNLVSTGQTCKVGDRGVNRYANYIGDPFSNFVYRYNGYNRIEDISKQYSCEDIGEALLIDFKHSNYLPLFDALGNMFEIETARKIYYQTGENKSFAANIFSNMVQETKCALIMKDDRIYHQPELSRKVYLNKLKWRVKNNLFQTEGVGFSERSKKESGLQKRKLFFIPYCVLIIPVLVDAVRLAFKNKDSYFINHIWYTEYTFFMIVWYVLLKIVRYPVKMDKTYGKM